MKKLIIGLILAALFFGCKTEASTTKTYTVTIDPNGGTLEQKTYTVEEGKTFTIPTAPSPAVAYYKVKDYINTTTNSPFTMGTTAVNGDITLKVEWSVDLYVVRDMLTSGSGIWKDATRPETVTFRKSGTNTLDLEYDFKSTYLDLKNLTITISPSDRADSIVKFTPKLYSTAYDYLKTLNDTKLEFLGSSIQDITIPPFLKQ